MRRTPAARRPKRRNGHWSCAGPALLVMERLHARLLREEAGPQLEAPIADHPYNKRIDRHCDDHLKPVTASR